MSTLTCQKHLFDLSEDITYLNCAYMGPLLKQSEEIGHNELQKRVNPANYSRNDFFEPVQQLKASFSQLINADDPDRIAIIPSVSYGISNAANNIDCSTKKTILLVGEQFPSNVYPWKKVADTKDAQLKFITPPQQKTNRTEAWNQSILDAIDDDTAAISMAHVHWADGTLFDLKAIRKKSKQAGALLIIDGTQSVGALPFDIQELSPDAVICAGYKWLLGPYSLGVAYYGPAFDHGVPIEENWINRKDSDQFENLINYQASYQPKASRYSVGEQSNFVYIPMLNASIQQLIEWQPARIQAYCKSLVSEYITAFLEMGCTLGSDTEIAYHLCGIRLPESINIAILKTQFEKHKVKVSIRGNAIRIAPNVYNDKSDMEVLVKCLQEAISQTGSLV